MRLLTRSLISLALAGTLSATTLEQLTLDEMIQKSTAIVRAKVVSSRGAYRGTDIYTYFQLQVVETWKAPASNQPIGEVAVPGGVANGIRQSVAGAPDLKAGQEYVLFLWTGKSGLTQVIGLSQGLFKISSGGTSGPMAQRAAASELMLDHSGNPVDDRTVSLQVAELRARVLRAVGKN